MDGDVLAVRSNEKVFLAFSKCAWTETKTEAAD